MTQRWVPMTTQWELKMESFDDVVLQSLVDTGVAEKIIHAVTATCVTYATKHGLRFVGFDESYKVAVFYDLEAPEEAKLKRVPYVDVKAEAFELLEEQQKVEVK